MAQKTDRPLNEKQQKFAILLASGKSNTEAYKMAGYAAKTDKVAAASGSKLAKKPEITACVAELQQENANYLKEEVRKDKKALIWDRSKRQQFWTEIANCDLQPLGQRLKATELLGKSEGDFVERWKDDTEEKIIIHDDVTE